MPRKDKIRIGNNSRAKNQASAQTQLNKQLHEQQNDPQLSELQYLLIHELRSPIADMNILIKSYFSDKKNLPIYQALLSRVRNLFDITEDALKHPLPFSGPVGWVDPDNLICDLVQNMTATMADKRLKLHYHADIPAGKKFQVNVQALQVLARNLLVNAVNYTKNGSIKVKLRRTAHSLRLSIHDSGIGMPLKYKTYLEDPNAEPISSHNGRGIGLILAHNAAKALNANIAVVSDDSYIIKVAESKLAYSGDLAAPNDHQRINSGTCCNIDVPGCWHPTKKAFRLPMSADLTHLKDYPELYQRVQKLGLYHDPKTALIRLQIREGVPPYLLFTLLSKMQTAIVYLPCSQQKLFSVLQSISQPTKKAKSQADHHGNKDTLLKDAGPTEDGRIVLIVDDSRISLSILTQMFTSLKWVVQIAKDGDTANDRLAKMNYDLIMCDACLPGTLVATPIPSIAISAVKQIADQLCKSPGNWLDASQKPIDEKELISLLKKWQSVKDTPAWDFKFIEKKLGSSKNVLLIAREALEDLLVSWRRLLVAIDKKDKVLVLKLVHRLLGGLRYTGFRRLTEEFEQLHQLALQNELPNKSTINQLRKIFRQSLVILKHEIMQSFSASK